MAETEGKKTLSSSQTEAPSKVESMENITEENLLEAQQHFAKIKKEKDCNNLYQQCFQLLSMGGLSAEIPRLVVFGQQSMGKTTLLHLSFCEKPHNDEYSSDYIMGGPIGYSSTTTGTKCPVVILIKSLPNDTLEPYATVDKRKISLSELPETMRKLMEKADGISDQEIQVEIVLKNGVSSIFVDLPGLKDDSKEGSEITKRVVRNYVKNNPHDLYILVKKASDDPANWPYQLKNFILKEYPSGLGLKNKQTIVVGTRAKDFLIGEKNDVSTCSQLVQRVKSRALYDANNQPFQLFLLELFSLSRSDKELTNFELRKKNMYQQIKDSKQEIDGLLSRDFDCDNEEAKSSLRNYFDISLFKSTLNDKFQNLLNDQLSSLEKKMIKKKFQVVKTIQDLKTKIAVRNTQTIREFIKLFIRELIVRVTELITGNYNYVILRGGEGTSFLNRWGGSLEDNLRDGHLLACELFPKASLYDEDFINRVLPKETEKIPSTVKDLMKYNVRAEIRDRYAIARVVQAVSDTTCMIDLSVGNSAENTKEVETALLHNILPAGDYVQVINKLLYQIYKQYDVTIARDSGLPTLPPGVGLKTWWKPAPQTHGNKSIQMLIPVELRSLVRTDGTLVGEHENVNSHDILAVVRQFAPANAVGTAAVQSDMQSTIDMLCVDLALIETIEPLDNTSAVWMNAATNKTKKGEANNGERTNIIQCEIFPPQLADIAGEHSDSKLLNQLSLTSLARWFKFTIGNLQPDSSSISEIVLLQMMRSVRNVIDKSDWEPVVADIVQMNIHSGILQLSRLISCSCGVAIRRIVKAALYETCRLVRSEELSQSLLFLVDNNYFIETIDNHLDEYCKQQALTCSNNMRDLIFEQTHALHFEMIEDFFTGCSEFEKEFLGSNQMKGIISKVRDDLHSRKKRLSVTDIYNKQTSVNSTLQTSVQKINEEVRIQFWVLKMLLAAPLTTKLYMNFVKDISDNTQHLAQEGKDTLSAENILEKYLQEKMLYDSIGIAASNTPYSKGLSSTALGTPLNETELAKMYRFSSDDLDVTKRKLESMERVLQYVSISIEGINALRSQILQSNNVDFLTRLDSATSY